MNLENAGVRKLIKFTALDTATLTSEQLKAHITILECQLRREVADESARIRGQIKKLDEVLAEIEVGKGMIAAAKTMANREMFKFLWDNIDDEPKIRKDRLALLALLDELDPDKIMKHEKMEIEKMNEETGGSWTEAFRRKGVVLDFNREGGLLDRKSKEFEEKDAAAKAQKDAKRKAFAEKCERDNSMLAKRDNR
jgi:hypothetical protein